MSESKLLYEDESYKIRGACFDVYNTLGGGIKEQIIERALKKELEIRNLTVSNQERISVFYKSEKIGVYVPDIVVNNSIIIELKSKYKLGFLINFGPQKLVIKRFVYTGIRINPPKSAQISV